MVRPRRGCGKRTGRTGARSDEPEQGSIRVPKNSNSDLTPRFALVFCTVAALTAISLALSVVLAAFGNDS